MFVINVTSLPIETLVQASDNPITELIQEINNNENSVAQELLMKLGKLVENGPVPSLVDADTSVGRTLEKYLGIDINSSKKPDYKGIELKSFRGGRGNRKNLFAQVPDWDISKMKSSKEILGAFGYQRDDVFKLYCTVSSLSPNSQGLYLNLDSKNNILNENSTDARIGNFVCWRMRTLENRLKEKHRETFWIEAQTVVKDGFEHFLYTRVEHTRNPIVSQFGFLLDKGIITLDHLIKNKAGRVVEKGPIFKIKPKSLDLLFPPSEIYYL